MRLIRQIKSKYFVHISIHASSQDVTQPNQESTIYLHHFNPRIRTECNGNNINDFCIPIYNVQFLNQSLTQFRVCFMSYLGDFRCEPLRKFLRALSSHQGGVEPPTFILILYTNLFICQGVIKILSFYFRVLEFPCFLVFFVVRTKEYF